MTISAMAIDADMDDYDDCDKDYCIFNVKETVREENKLGLNCKLDLDESFK